MSSASRYVFASLTRIADLHTLPFDVRPLPHDAWAGCDYVVAAVVGHPPGLRSIELRDGRMIDVMAHDLIVGALGRRAATLEAVGTWREVGDDLRLHALTPAGLFGKATSASLALPALLELEYRGHVVRDGRKLCMGDFVETPVPRALEIPVILIVGTSMSSGKTTTGRAIVHELTRAGLSVAGAKLTGAGRYRDVLSLADAGAQHILDFVDAGLPSTVGPEQRVRAAIRGMMSRIAHLDVDVLVAEAGASPLEPYNGAAAIDEIGAQVRFTVLCASDPYAVVGVQTAFGIRPDLVAGPAANTSAAIALVRKLTGGIEAINALDPGHVAPLRAALARALPELLPP